MTGDLAARAVACKAWRWMPGMRVVQPDGEVPLRLVESECLAHEGPPRDTLPPSVQVATGLHRRDIPDLTDPATLGCLLALVREAWGVPTLCPTCTAGPGIAPAWGWVLPVRVGRFAPLDVWSATEAEALVCALEAAA